VIVSDDQWMIKGCPVSGPSLSVGRDNRLTVTWYTGFDNGPHGVFWSETNDGGRTFSPRKLLHESVIQGTPALVGDREGAATGVWETIENGMPRVMGIPIVVSEQDKPPPTYLGAGQLPAATISGNQLFIAAVVPDADKKAVWLLRAHRK
jgi:hypothetical protein